MGHSPSDVWEYTPRQLSGFLQFAVARRKRETAEKLALGALAARGEPKELQKRLKELQKQ